MTNWRKSSYSSDSNICVELAFDGRAAGVRDSKNTSGPALTFPDTGLTTFLTAAKSGRLDG